MPLPHTDWTVEMVNQLPDDGNRYEVIDGELFVTPAPSLTHQRAVGCLYVALREYAHAIGLEVLMAPAAVTFSKRREVQPDVLVIPRMAGGKLAGRFGDVGVLVLAVEVLSPGTKRTDRTVKRVLYQSESVRDYWIIDTDARAFERWIPGSVHADVFTQAIEWQPLPSHEPLTLDIAQYFREVFGE